MNKYMFLGAGLCVAMALTSCGSSESAYKKAYLKAQQRTEAQQQVTPTTTTEVPTVTPVTTTPVTQTRVTDNNDATPVRQENVEVQSGAALKAYSVVVGSFTLRANAEGEVQRLINKGYDARLVYSSANNMYRVVASSFDYKADAIQSRDQLAAQYQGAWLLYAK
jgi:cell division protein FtsN